MFEPNQRVKVNLSGLTIKGVAPAAQLAFDNDAFPNACPLFANDEALSIAPLFVHGPLPS